MVRKRYLFFGIVALVVVGTLTAMALGGRPPFRSTREPTPSPTITQKGPLTVAGVYPATGEVALGGTDNAVVVALHRPIDVLSARVRVDPAIAIDVSVRGDNPGRLIIKPRTQWVPGATYTITVSRGLLSDDGEAELKEDIVLRYSTTEPSLPSYRRPP